MSLLIGDALVFIWCACAWLSGGVRGWVSAWIDWCASQVEQHTMMEAVDEYSSAPRVGMVGGSGTEDAAVSLESRPRPRRGRPPLARTVICTRTWCQLFHRCCRGLSIHAGTAARRSRAPASSSGTGACTRASIPSAAPCAAPSSRRTAACRRTSSSTATRAPHVTPTASTLPSCAHTARCTLLPHRPARFPAAPSQH